MFLFFGKTGNDSFKWEDSCGGCLQTLVITHTSWSYGWQEQKFSLSLSLFLSFFLSYLSLHLFLSFCLSLSHSLERNPTFLLSPSLCHFRYDTCFCLTMSPCPTKKDTNDMKLEWHFFVWGIWRWTLNQNGIFTFFRIRAMTDSRGTF